MFGTILKTIRINHYIKNIVIFLPFVFSLNIHSLKYALLAFFAFCFVSSAAYIFNDLIDIEQDKLHPFKKQRPIAKGEITKKHAIALLVFLLFLSFLFAYFVNFKCLTIVVFYFILNIFYSLFLKNIIFVDVLCIALGFILRVIAGFLALNIAPSYLIIFLTFFGSLFFTFLKRKMEMNLSTKKGFCRKSIKLFTLKSLNFFVLINAFLFIFFYIIFAISLNFYWTILPFIVIVFRILFLAYFDNPFDDPVIFIENDRFLQIFFVVYFAAFIL